MLANDLTAESIILELTNESVPDTEFWGKNSSQRDDVFCFSGWALKSALSIPALAFLSPEFGMRSRCHPLPSNISDVATAELSSLSLSSSYSLSRPVISRLA
jgi:hypothetical protein